MHKLNITEKMVLKFDFNTFYRIKFIFNQNIKIGMLFYDGKFKVYSDETINFEDIKILKIYSKIELNDGAQIKFYYNNKLLRGYIHYFDNEFMFSNILVIDYKNYDKSWNINLCDIKENDLTII